MYPRSSLTFCSYFRIFPRVFLFILIRSSGLAGSLSVSLLLQFSGTEASVSIPLFISLQSQLLLSARRNRISRSRSLRCAVASRLLSPLLCAYAAAALVSTHSVAALAALCATVASSTSVALFATSPTIAVATVRACATSASHVRISSVSRVYESMCCIIAFSASISRLLLLTVCCSAHACSCV